MDDTELLEYREGIPFPVKLPKEFEQTQAVEEKILHYYRIEGNDDIEILNTEISLGEYGTGWIHWYRCKSKSKLKSPKTLVLLHGYGGGSILFSKMLSSLSEVYTVCCVDLIGLSQSSRPTAVKSLREIDKIIAFFTDSLVKWVEATGIAGAGKGKFILAGHSFGGYIASWFMAKYPEYIERLILISPAGFSRISKTENDEYDAARVQKMNLKAKFFHFFRKCVWKYEITYEWLYTKAFFLPRKTILTHMIATRLKVATKNETALWKEYYHNVLSLPEAASSFVYKLFMFPRVVAHKPLEDLFENHSSDVKSSGVKVHIIYGDYDWMHRDGAIRLTRTQPNKFYFHILPQAGHHMNIDNPNALSSLIKSFSN